jgi:hypothetical protein
VPLNVDPGAAANGEYIAEALWLYENDGGSPETYLEVGDTAGGAKIGGHVNEWARMYYWVDGSTGLNIQNFIDYSPADSQPRSFELAWNGGTDWLVCAGGTCPIVAHWKNPVNFRPNTFLTVGLEINNSQRPLDSSKNSGDFLDQSVLVKYPTGLWQGWPSALSQVDSPCGSPPTCLIGSWNQPTPPYDNWLNGKPGQ